MQGLTYSPTIVRGGGAYFLNTDSAHYYSATVSVVKVPSLDPSATSVPPCALVNVSTIVTSGAMSPFLIPQPVRGTDRRGNPVVLVLKRNDGNTSQIAVQLWSAFSGSLVYNVTWACGSPSYLYTCPPTNDGIPNGLNGAYFTRGTLFFGGGSWSSQQYFMAAIPALATSPAIEEGASLDAVAGVPVLTFVNSSSNQGTWFTTGTSKLFTSGGAPNGWPLTVQYIPSGAGTCTQPGYTSQMISTTISRNGWSVASTPFGYGDGASAACPFRQAEIPGWYSTAACAGSSYAFPDNLVDPDWVMEER